MSDIQIYITLGVFAAVVLAIAFNVLDMAVATVLGATVLFSLGILTFDDIRAAEDTAGGTLALLFGGMVVARTLAKTGIFERLGNRLLLATGGSGRRYLFLLIALVAPVCAVLPNATTVILLAPIIIQVAESLEIDFVGPMVLTAIISNSAGLLTLVGDPATFLVGSSIGMSFVAYLKKVSLGGLVCLLALVPVLPFVMRDIWRIRRPPPRRREAARIEHPWFVALALVTLAIMLGLFMFGELLPWRITPPNAAIIGAALSLLAVYSAKVEPVDNVIRDIDWKTLVFLFSIFCLVQGVTRTGLLQKLALKMNAWFDGDVIIVGLFLLVGIALLSSFLANIPVVAASILLTKGYMVAAELVPDTALASGFAQWPATVIPVFIAMMFGATLGGNFTLIGASANVVSAGICGARGRPVSFAMFARYGVPLAACQIAVAALCVLIMFRMR
ncbi:MAG TPA: SLC13 family permease [Geobacteraceae bacterium]|nr:SLC13 family permease [Geobacteraceae bacterium]